MLSAMFQARSARLSGVFIAAVALLFLGNTVASAQFVDRFSDAPILLGETGVADGSNVGATLEPQEPEHARRPGGRSVWISWIAPADGIATFTTEAETFDTMIASYVFMDPRDTTLDRLRRVSHNDDDSLTQRSLMQFGARAGTRYFIAVDGFAGASGAFRARWSFLAAASPPPIIVSVPEDRAVREGDTVTLSVDLVETPELEFQWRFNDDSIDNAEGRTLVISSMQSTNVGFYSLRIRIRDRVSDVRFETPPTDLQINSEGQVDALARDKLADALRTPVESGDLGGMAADFQRSRGAAKGGGVVRGYNGTQIFNTTYATADPSEPPHCGISGIPTYWFAYEPPANGIAVFDTSGTGYPTVLAVYSYTEPVETYDQLIAVDCDLNSQGPVGGSRVIFYASQARHYAIVVGGLAGARGVTRLNYSLQPPVPAQMQTSLSQGEIVISFQTALGQNYVVEARDSFSSAWTRTRTALVGNGGIRTFTNALEQPIRMFRLRSE